MRIVNIIQRYPPAIGGSETWCQEICRYLAKKGHNVRVLTMDINKEEEYWREPLDEDHFISLGRLGFDKDVFIRRYKRSLPIHTFYHVVLKNLLDKRLGIYFYGPHSSEMYGRMWREIKKADVVFLHTIPYPHNYIAFIIAKLLRKRTVIVPHFHPGHPHYERNSHYWLLKNCDCVIAVTEFEKRYLEGRGIKGERIIVTGNGIHPELYIPANLDDYRKTIQERYRLKNEDRVVVFIGRKTEEKGVGHLIEAVRRLIHEMPIKLFLIGPTFDWYNDIYDRLSDKEKEHIIEMGEIPHQEKVNLLHISDLLVLPSRYEAFGIVFLEAWICGVPVIGTTEGAMPDVIGDDGFLCRYGDVEDLRAKIKEALNDSNKTRKMAERGRTKVINNYTWQVIGEKTEKAIKQIYGKKKILFCCSAYPPNFIGGAELIAHEQAKVLKKLGHDVVIFAGELNRGGKRYSIRNDHYEGLPVYRICLHPEDYSADFFNFFHEEIHQPFDHLLEDFSPDVMHFHNIIGLSVGLIQIAKRRKIKTILTLHDYWGICHKNTLMKSIGDICGDDARCEECMPYITEERWKDIPIQMRKDYILSRLNKIDAFISPSRYLAERYIKAGIEREKIHVIPNGIDLKRFKKVSRNSNKKIRFSFVGYIGKHKGIHVLMDALSYIKDKDRMMLNLVGDGEDRSRIEEFVKQNGFGDMVKFWGKVDNSSIESVYKDTDVLILPSVWPDNHPVSICEAMASGIPVIASRIGGIPELVEDGKTGYLFEAGDSKELAQRMSEFIIDRDRITRFGDNAMRKISEYPIDRQVERILRVYEEDALIDNPTEDGNLIICAGEKVDDECIKAMEVYRRRNPWQRFVMIDWLDEEDIKDGLLLWVVDKDADVEDMHTGLRNRLPVVVPRDNGDVRSLCIDGNCGLLYKDHHEIVSALEYLYKNMDVRRVMGEQGFRLAYRNEVLDRLKMNQIVIPKTQIGPQLKEMIKDTIRQSPILGSVIIWLWRLIHLPRWFYRLNRHFEHVVLQVDSTIEEQSRMKTMDEKQQVSIQRVNQFLETLPKQLSDIHERINNLSVQLQKLDALSSSQQRHDFIIQDITNSIQSINARLDKIIKLNDFYMVKSQPYKLETTVGDKDPFYLNFEDIFRGARNEIYKRQKVYIPYIIEAKDKAEMGRYFLDVGCGRGEFLKILKEIGVPHKGIEINELESKRLRSEGFDVELIDANTFLEGIDDNILVGISCIQVIEHLPIEYAERFLKLAYRKISTNGVIIIETINPRCLYAMGNFYLDPTHIRPYPPQLLKYMLEWYGFKDIMILYSSPCPEAFRMADFPEHNYIDYAIIGWRREDV